MVGGEKDSRLVTVALGVAVIIAAATLVYVNLPHEATNPQNNASSNQTNEQAYLIISYGNQSFNYTLDELSNMESFTGSGGYIKKSGATVGPDNYTGVRITTLLQNFDNLPSNFTISAIASDGYTVSYSYDTVMGHVTLYNESGNESGIGNTTMLVAYMENGHFLNESSGGPFRIAFVDDGAISSSKLWIRSVVHILIEQSANS